MKKILLTLLLIILFIPGVNAEEGYTIKLHKSGCDSILQTYNRYKSLIDSTLSKYASSSDYYVITLSEAGNLNDINLIVFDKDSIIGFDVDDEYYYTDFYIQNYKYMFQFYDDRLYDSTSREDFSHNQHRNLSSFLPDNLIYGNYNFKQFFWSSLNITDFYNDIISIPYGSNLPYLLDLYNYDSWDEYTSNQGYTEVNLNNYEYVILNLKDYSKKEAFETNLKVKGMIGITPVYQFGTIEKEVITDRCNLSYEDYTDYRFFILDSDLKNNAVYYVKACEENSSFKFDSSVFDVTYITTETVNDPVITVGGVKYNTIPFKELNNSANQNEENNFIPGESGSSLTDIIDNISEFTGDIWNAVSSFMGLATKFFNTLPPEFRYLSITAFTTLIFISIIKFMKG